MSGLGEGAWRLETPSGGLELLPRGSGVPVLRPPGARPEVSGLVGPPAAPTRCGRGSWGDRGALPGVRPSPRGQLGGRRLCQPGTQGGLGQDPLSTGAPPPRSRGRSFRCVSAEAPETQACPRGCTHSRSAPPGAPSRSATGADDSGRVGTAAGRSLHSSGGRRLPDGGNHPWGRTVQSPESGLHHLQAQHSRGAGVLSLSVPRFTPLYRGSSAAPRGC